MNVSSLLPLAAAYFAACHAASMVDLNSGPAAVEQGSAEAAPRAFDGITAFAAFLHNAKFHVYAPMCPFTKSKDTYFFSELQGKLSSAHRKICIQFKGANGVECLSKAVRRTMLAERCICALLDKVSAYL